jgi:hypothetical protein
VREIDADVDETDLLPPRGRGRLGWGLLNAQGMPCAMVARTSIVSTRRRGFV